MSDATCPAHSGVKRATNQAKSRQKPASGGDFQVGLSVRRNVQSPASPTVESCRNRSRVRIEHRCGRANLNPNKALQTALLVLRRLTAVERALRPLLSWIWGPPLIWRTDDCGGGLWQRLQGGVSARRNVQSPALPTIESRCNRSRVRIEPGCRPACLISINALRPALPVLRRLTAVERALRPLSSWIWGAPRIWHTINRVGGLPSDDAPSALPYRTSDGYNL